jgi:hypothetical protein
MARESGNPAAHPGRAATKAVDKQSIRISLPCNLSVTVPSPDRLAFYGGVGLLAALQIVEWPVAAALVVGHILVENRHNRLLQEFGKALEEA